MTGGWTVVVIDVIWAGRGGGSSVVEPVGRGFDPRQDWSGDFFGPFSRAVNFLCSYFGICSKTFHRSRQAYIYIIMTLAILSKAGVGDRLGTPSPKQPFSFLARLAINSYLALCQQESDSVACGSAWLTVHSGGWGYRVICVFPSSLQLKK